MFARLRAGVWELVRLPERVRYRRDLERRKFALPSGGPVLNYGGALPRGAGALVAGGRVKLRHLDRAFPERDDFNVLYLVSSAVPRQALELVRWAKTRGVKFVWNQNGVAFPAWAGDRLAETNRPMAALRAEADFVVNQSAFCRESAERFLGPSAAAERVLFNPVDLAEFSPAPARGPVECWNLLTAGTHYQGARVLLPLAALRHLRDTGCPARLTIAGALRWANADAEVRAEIARLELSDAVTLRPAFSQAEAVELYRAAHVLIHPKSADPCPTVVIEALACGVPVIGSRTGGLPELVGDDGGELIEVPVSWEQAAFPTAEQFAEAAMKVILKWPVRTKAARARAERLFDAERWVEEHQAIFHEVLGR